MTEVQVSVTFSFTDRMKNDFNKDNLKEMFLPFHKHEIKCKHHTEQI